MSLDVIVWVFLGCHGQQQQQQQQWLSIRIYVYFDGVGGAEIHATEFSLPVVVVVVTTENNDYVKNLSKGLFSPNLILRFVRIKFGPFWPLIIIGRTKFRSNFFEKKLNKSW